MPTTAITTPNELLTASGVTFLAKNRAAMLKELNRPVADAAMRTMQKVDGGFRWQFGFETEWHSEPTRVRAGAGSYINVGRLARTTLTPAWDEPAYVVQPAFISRRDESQNAGQSRIIDLANRRLMNRDKHLHQQLEQMLLFGPNASGSWAGMPAWVGWNHFNGTDDATYGHVEEDTSGTNSVHNVSRSTYPASTHPLLHNLVVDLAAGFGTNALNAFALLQGKMMVRNQTLQAGEWYFTKECLANWTRANRGSMVYGSIQAAMDGNISLAQTFLGKPIKVVEALPYNGSASASDPWSAVYVPWSRSKSGDTETGGTRIVAYTGEAMSSDPWETIPGTVGVRISIAHLFGQLISEDPGGYILVFDGQTY